MKICFFRTNSIENRQFEKANENPYNLSKLFPFPRSLFLYFKLFNLRTWKLIRVWRNLFATKWRAWIRTIAVLETSTQWRIGFTKCDEIRKVKIWRAHFPRKSWFSFVELMIRDIFEKLCQYLTKEFDEKIAFSQTKLKVSSILEAKSKNRVRALFTWRNMLFRYIKIIFSMLLTSF